VKLKFRAPQSKNCNILTQDDAADWGHIGVQFPTLAPLLTLPAAFWLRSMSVNMKPVHCRCQTMA